MKWSHCYGWPTQMKDVMWQVWKMGLTWRSPEGMIEEGLENLMLLDNSRSQGLKTCSFHFFEIFLIVGFISSSSYSMIKTDSLLSSMQCFFLFPQSCWTSLRIFPVTIQRQLCNVLRLDDMHAFLPDLVHLFAFQSLLCPSDLPAYSCASHPLNCKCRAYLGISMMITPLVVY